jgi:large subunit ribosomal protein L29
MSKNAQTLEKLRDQPDDELRTALRDTRDELFRLHLGQHTNQVTSTALLTTKRREIAQILTILRSRQLGLETQASAQKTKASEEAATTTEKPTKKTKAASEKKAKAKS